MPFRPLPPSFVDQLTSPTARGLVCLELGCGDGRFGAQLRELGVEPIGLDHLPPTAGTCAALVGEARFPPLRPQSCDLIVAPNLVRHLLSADPGLGFLTRWVALLKPGGSVYIFEDEPAERPASRRNFAALQAFLAELMPGRRGPLLAAADFDGRWRRGLTWRIAAGGRLANRARVDAGAVMALLRGDGGKPAPRVAELVRSIGRDGIEPGGYWWRRLVAAGSS